MNDKSKSSKSLEYIDKEIDKNRLSMALEQIAEQTRRLLIEDIIQNGFHHPRGFIVFPEVKIV